MRWLLLLPLLLAAPTSADDLHQQPFLDGGTQYRPPVEHVHVMRAPARRVVLHLRFERGIYRKSKSGKTRPVFTGLYIAVNDADRPTGSVRNPFLPADLQPGKNPDWRAFVAPDWPYPNPAPGYWYTLGRTGTPHERPIVLQFEEPRRYRILLRGVVDERPTAVRVPTLRGVTEYHVKQPKPEPRPRPKRTSPKTAGRSFGSAIRIDRDAPGTVKAGRKFVYTIRIANRSDGPIEDIVVTESGDANFELVEATPKPASTEGSTLAWRFERLVPGEERAIGIEAVVPRPGESARS